MPEPRLPQGYALFRELNLCSNVLVNVPVPLLVGDWPAFLVGRSLSLLSPLPLIWLAAPASPDSREWNFVVESNRPLRPLIAIQTDKEGETVQVYVGTTLVLRARQSSLDTAIIDALDLRPLGLVAYGDESELRIGAMTYGRNRFQNLQTAFAITSQGVAKAP